ncbi:hypothetical protein HYY75_12420 [bacterium]|nr:hypothetical protein [bacterium]
MKKITVVSTFLFFAAFATFNFGCKLLVDKRLGFSDPGSISKNYSKVQILAEGLVSPWNVAVDESKIYCIDSVDGSVKSFDKNLGGEPAVLFPPDGKPGWDIVQDAKNLYFSKDKSEILKVQKVGGLGNLLAGPSYSVKGLSLSPDGEELFFASFSPIDKIQKIAISGKGPTILLNYQNSPLYLSTYSDTLYWTQGSGLNGSVRSLGFLDKTPNIVFEDADSPTAICTPGSGRGAGSVFWLETGSSKKLKQRTPSGGAIILSGSIGSGNEKGLAVDEEFAYFNYGNSIAKVPINGGEISVLADLASAQFPRGLAIDESYVFWASEGLKPGNGSLRRVPK